MDILEVTQKLINFTAHLRSLELDLHEYVALKVMLLLNPGMLSSFKMSLIFCCLSLPIPHSQFLGNRIKYIKICV